MDKIDIDMVYWVTRVNRFTSRWSLRSERHHFRSVETTLSRHHSYVPHEPSQSITYIYI